MPKEQKYVILWRQSSVFPYDEYLYRHGGWTKEPYGVATFSYEDAKQKLEGIKVEHPDAKLSIEPHPYSLTFD